MKICAAVIVYYPDPEQLRRNLRSFIGNVEHVIVWDNTPAGEGVNIDLSEFSNITVLGRGRNMGISYALNRAVRYCRYHGFTHLLTMDQDSVWHDFDAYRRFADSHGTNYIYTPRTNGNNRTADSWETADYYYTSGALYPMEVIDKTGPFNEDYFIDQIDTEYGFRAAMKGIRIVRCNLCELTHQLGYSKTAGGKKFNTYSPARLYDINRNCIKVARDLRTRESLHNCYNCLVIYGLKMGWNILCYDDDKAAKLRAIISGIWSGLFSRIPRRH